MEEQHKQQFVIKRKKMKKTLMIVLLSITSANANLFVSLGYATSPNTQTVEDENGKNMKFDDISHFKLNIGDVIFTNEERGKGSNSMYLGLGGASVSKSEDSLEYTSTLLNLGMTHTFNNNIAVFGGIGLEYQKIANQNEDVASNHKLNGNIGVMAYLLETSIGIIVEYDSAPNLVSAGLAWRF